MFSPPSPSSGLGTAGYSTSSDRRILNTAFSSDDDTAERLIPIPPQPDESQDSSITDDVSEGETTPPEKQARVSVAITCQKYYENNGNCKKILLSMCIGLEKDDPSYCVVEEDNTYKNSKNKGSFKPANKDLAAEVIRRFKWACGKEKRCASWSGPKLKKWLVDNPITESRDVLFLKREEKSFRQTLNQAAAERSAQDELHSDHGPSWIGIFPWLQMYHAIIEDDVLPAYLQVHDWSNREEIDARNSSSRPKNFYDLCSNKFNDPSFVPESNVYGDLHEDFMESMVLAHSVTTPLATPDKIKDKLSSARFLALRVIKDWEKSGNGSGQRAEDNTELGHIVEGQRWLNPDRYAAEEYIDGDNRKNFLRGSPSHVLYLWQLFDAHDILHRTLSVLPSSLGASSDGVSSTLSDESGSTATHRRKQQAAEKAEESSFRDSVGMALTSLARSNNNMFRVHTYQQIRTARQNSRLLRMEYSKCDDEDERAVIKEEMDGLRAEIRALEGALRESPEEG